MRLWIRPYVVLFAACCLISSATAQPSRRPKPGSAVEPECALFKSNDTVALMLGGSTFIEIGDVYIDDGFSLDMEVLPSPLFHNGILFAAGSKRLFDYYEWKSAAVHTQFIVVEFIFSALALTVKAEGSEHLRQIEVYRTYPKPYRIDDAMFHRVRAYRDKRQWTLRIDDLNVTRPITNKTDVQLLGKAAYIGGRPGYTHHQFQGIIRNLRINGRPISLSGKRAGNTEKGTAKYVEVWHCSAEPVQRFINWIKDTKDFFLSQG